MKYAVLICSLFSFLGFSQSTILNEDFQQGIPSTWTIRQVDTNIVNTQVSEYTSAWIAMIDPDNANDTVASSTSYFTSPASANRWLISPQITLGTYGNYVSWQAKSHDPSFPESYKVLISSSINFEADSTDTVEVVYDENFEWDSLDIDISTLSFNSKSVFIAFVLDTYDGFKFYLDDIKVRVNDPVGMEEKSKAKFTISPNPVNNLVKINSETNFEKIEIKDQLGNLVFQGNSLIKIVDCSNFSNGLYTISLISENSISNKKLMILH